MIVIPHVIMVPNRKLIIQKMFDCNNSYLPLISDWDLQTICQPLFDNFGISFFDFGRMYDDGYCLMFSTNEKLIHYLFEQQYCLFSPVPTHLLQNKFYYYLPNTGPYQQVVYDVSNYFNIGHAFDIFDCQDGYVDVCCFAASTQSSEMINTYFNNINNLNNFIRFFKNKITDILSRSDNAFLLPEKMRLNFNSKDISNKLDPIYFSEKGKQLSKRETEIILLLIKGKSTKKIAMELNLSLRTIENYLNNIKLKTDSNPKSELLEKMIGFFDPLT